MTEERTPIHYGMDVTYLGRGRVKGSYPCVDPAYESQLQAAYAKAEIVEYEADATGRAPQLHSYVRIEGHFHISRVGE